MLNEIAILVIRKECWKTEDKLLWLFHHLKIVEIKIAHYIFLRVTITYYISDLIGKSVKYMYIAAGKCSTVVVPTFVLLNRYSGCACEHKNEIALWRWLVWVENLSGNPLRYPGIGLDEFSALDGFSQSPDSLQMPLIPRPLLYHIPQLDSVLNRHQYLASLYRKMSRCHKKHTRQNYQVV